MVDLRSNFLGIKSPNPFWLASAPPTDRKTNVERAFRAGWGGVVWKTLGEAGPAVVNNDAGMVTAIWDDPNEIGVSKVVRPPAVNETFAHGLSQFDEKPWPLICSTVWVFSEALVGESDVTIPVDAGGREAYMR